MASQTLTPPVGNFMFWSNNLSVVSPRNDKTPAGSELIFSKKGTGFNSRFSFQFVPIKGAGHFGYIQFVGSDSGSKLFVHPKGDNTLDPVDGSGLVLKQEQNAGALFGFAEDDDKVILILHKASNKAWRSRDGNPNPKENSIVTLNSDVNSDISKFLFLNQSNEWVSPYPHPELRGHWNLLRAFVTPIADHTYKQKYKIGRSRTETEMEKHAWKVSAKVAFGFFSGKTEIKAEYSGAVQETSSETWGEEKEESYTISVTGNRSVFVWQFVFTMSQCDEEVRFLSTIIGDTADPNTKPSITMNPPKK